MRVMVNSRIRDGYRDGIRAWVRDTVGASFMTGYKGRFVVIFSLRFRHKFRFR